MIRDVGGETWCGGGLVDRAADVLARRWVDVLRCLVLGTAGWLAGAGVNARPTEGAVVLNVLGIASGVVMIIGGLMVVLGRGNGSRSLERMLAMWMETALIVGVAFVRVGLGQ